MKTITAIVLDGFHKGHVVRLSAYMPTIRLLKPSRTIVDYCCPGYDSVDKELSESEYHAVFHGVDGDVVLYSKSGKSIDILGMFNFHEKSLVPWTNNTHLVMGYHNEPIIRKDDGTQMTEYEKGFEQGVGKGRIMQAKEMRIH